MIFYKIRQKLVKVKWPAYFTGVILPFSLNSRLAWYKLRQCV